MIKTAVEGMEVGDGKVLAEPVTPRARVEPVTVPAPFAAGVDQTVGDQRLQDVQPARALAAGRHARLPAGVQWQLLAAAKKRGYLAASVGGEEAPICGAVFGRKAPERKGRRVALSVW